MADARLSGSGKQARGALETRASVRPSSDLSQTRSLRSLIAFLLALILFLPPWLYTTPPRARRAPVASLLARCFVSPVRHSSLIPSQCVQQPLPCPRLAMSLRHTPRQAERDVRLHDPHAHHSHSLPPPPPHAQLGHPPHLNGNGVPSTPGPLTGPSAHPQPQLMSPPVMSNAVPNGTSSSSIQKLAQANEQTWLLIGGFSRACG